MRHIKYELGVLDRGCHDIFVEYIHNCVDSAIINRDVQLSVDYVGRELDAHIIWAMRIHRLGLIDWVVDNYPQYVSFFIQKGIHWQREANTVWVSLRDYLE